MNHSKMAQTIHITEGSDHHIETDLESCGCLLFLSQLISTKVQLLKSEMPTKGNVMKCPDFSTRCLFFRFLSIKL